MGSVVRKWSFNLLDNRTRLVEAFENQFPEGKITHGPVGGHPAERIDLSLEVPEERAPELEIFIGEYQRNARHVSAS